jgi:TRAP-type C4-dicarboxylate transport system substrate-binding protein
LNVFGRAELQRTVVLVVALLLTAGSTDALAREFRAADTQNEEYPTAQAPRFMERQVHERKQAETAGVVLVPDIDKKPFEAAMTGIYARAQRDPVSAQLIERIRKVE